MTDQKQKKLARFFREDLTKNILPFWANHAVDFEFGGFTDFLDQKGNLLSDEKSGWFQGRGTWIFSWVYNKIDTDTKWLKAAKAGADFLINHGFDSDGRVFFRYKRNGDPIIKRRYLFSEVFAVMALAEYSIASNDKGYLKKALETEAVIQKWNGKLEPKILPSAYSLRGHSMTMIVINMFQILREATGEKEKWTEKINQQIKELFTYFVKPEYKTILECCLPDGSLLDTPAGRTINPGHCIETAWFLMEEALYQKDEELLKKSTEILLWSIEKGWDRKYGGLFSFLDVKGLHPAPIEWDMKYWWPHCEMIYATLLGTLTAKEHPIIQPYAKKLEKWFYKSFNYAYRHFPDKKYGEWFGYLRRDGSIALKYKGNHFKGPFHIPRMEGKSILLLEKQTL